MNTKSKSLNPDPHGGVLGKVAPLAAFTLIEMMVVVALIGIMIAGVFKLISAAGSSNQRATTVQKLQKLENALSGFYAEYGSYPPVLRHESGDPSRETLDDTQQNRGYGELKSDSDRFAARCNRAAASQPISYEYPCWDTPEENARLRNWFEMRGITGVLSANEVSGSFKAEHSEWSDSKAFKFGLLSFLLPRLQTMAQFDKNYNMTTGKGPNPVFFRRARWTKYNQATEGAYRTQIERESVACARWLPNFANMLDGGGMVLGVRLSGDRNGHPRTYWQGGQWIAVVGATLLDGWERPFYYQSLPPYQSYRVWSAGPDGNTFPPDYPMENLTAAERRQVSGWIEDDVVGFDR